MTSSKTIIFQPSGLCLSVEPGETILAAAKRLGFSLPNACQSGSCHLCEAQLRAGSVRLKNDNKILRAPLQGIPHNIYSCLAYPMEDCELEVKHVLAPGQLPTHELCTQVIDVRPASETVKIVKLRLPAGKPIDYYPGQYLLINVSDQEQAAFSIANAPNKSRSLELHIGAAPESTSYQALAPKLNVGELLNISLPYGETTLLGLAAAKQIILIAAATGLSQIKALLEGLIQAQDTRPVRLYWGARTAAGLYMHAEIAELARKHPHITYTPVISDDPTWQGRTGLVHQAALEDIKNFNDVGIICGGSPVMVYSAFDDFIAAGMDPTQMHSDVFAYAPR